MQYKRSFTAGTQRKEIRQAGATSIIGFAIEFTEINEHIIEAIKNTVEENVK